MISRIAWLAFLGILFASTDVCAGDRKPNVVLILADDLGINDLGCYGRKEHHTPNLDRLASQGMRFTCNYCAQPICSPARAAIMTGLAPARLHLTTFLPGRADCPSQKLLHPKINQQLPLEHRTLAEYLKDAGYATACIGKWHLGGAGFSPKEQGFDFVHAGTPNTKPSDTEGGKGEYDLTRKAIEFIEKNKEKPFFVYLPHNTPHIPLGAKPELIAKYKDTFNPNYAAMMHSMDETVGMLLAKLDELKLTENTIVIFTSDNGGLHVLEFPDSPATHNTPFRAGKGFLYEGGLRVPFIIRWPGAVPAGKATDTPITQLDYVPTLLSACGVKTNTRFDGINVMPIWKGEKMEERAIYWHFPHYTNQGSRPAGAVRANEFKFIEHYEDGRVEVFDLSKDPGEEKDISGDNEIRTMGMKNMLSLWRNTLKVQENTANPEFDAMLHKKLYVDVDVSKLKAMKTAADTRAKFQEWRDGMNAVVPKKKKDKK